MAATLCDLPTELLLKIGEDLSPDNVLSLLLTSRRCLSRFSPVLRECVHRMVVLDEGSGEFGPSDLEFFLIRAAAGPFHTLLRWLLEDMKKVTEPHQRYLTNALCVAADDICVQLLFPHITEPNATYPCLTFKRLFRIRHPIPCTPGANALCEAVKHGRESVVRQLLTSGKIDVNSNGYWEADDTLLCSSGSLWTSMLYKNTEMFTDCSWPYWKARTPLYEAAIHGHTTILKLLLRKGADANTRRRASAVITMVPETPLEVAVFEGHFEIAKELLAFGALMDAGVLDWAKRGRHWAKLSRFLRGRMSENGVRKTLKECLSVWRNGRIQNST